MGDPDQNFQQNETTKTLMGFYLENRDVHKLQLHTTTAKISTFVQDSLPK